MKMIFEIRDLNYATPATATRAGIVCPGAQAFLRKGPKEVSRVSRFQGSLCSSENEDPLMERFFQKSTSQHLQPYPERAYEAEA